MTVGEAAKGRDFHGGAPRVDGVAEEETIGEHFVVDDIPTSRDQAHCGHRAPLNNEDNQPLTPIPTDRDGPQLQDKMPRKGSFFNNSYKPVDLRKLILQAELKTSCAMGTADTADSGSDSAMSGMTTVYNSSSSGNSSSAPRIAPSQVAAKSLPKMPEKSAPSCGDATGYALVLRDSPRSASSVLELSLGTEAPHGVCDTAAHAAPRADVNGRENVRGEGARRRRKKDGRALSSCLAFVPPGLGMCIPRRRSECEEAGDGSIATAGAERIGEEEQTQFRQTMLESSLGNKHNMALGSRRGAQGHQFIHREAALCAPEIGRHLGRNAHTERIGSHGHRRGMPVGFPPNTVTGLDGVTLRACVSFDPHNQHLSRRSSSSSVLVMQPRACSLRAACHGAGARAAGLVDAADVDGHRGKLGEVQGPYSLQPVTGATECRVKAAEASASPMLEQKVDEFGRRQSHETVLLYESVPLVTVDHKADSQGLRHSGTEKEVDGANGQQQQQQQQLERAGETTTFAREVIDWEVMSVPQSKVERCIGAAPAASARSPNACPIPGLQQFTPDPTPRITTVSLTTARMHVSMEADDAPDTRRYLALSSPKCTQGLQESITRMPPAGGETLGGDCVVEQDLDVTGDFEHQTPPRKNSPRNFLRVEGQAALSAKRRKKKLPGASPSKEDSQALARRYLDEILFAGAGDAHSEHQRVVGLVLTNTDGGDEGHQIRHSTELTQFQPIALDEEPNRPLDPPAPLCNDEPARNEWVVNIGPDVMIF